MDLDGLAKGDRMVTVNIPRGNSIQNGVLWKSGICTEESKSGGESLLGGESKRGIVKSRKRVAQERQARQPHRSLVSLQLTLYPDVTEEFRQLDIGQDMHRLASPT